MAELPKSASDSSISFPSELGLCGMENSQKMDSPQGKVPENGFFVKRTERCDSFVLEMDELTLHVADNDFASSSRSTLHRTLSRKGSCLERKFPEREPEAPPKGGGEKSVVVPVGTMGSDPTTTNVDSIIRYKRSMSMRRSPWLDPRRILMLFATVSSMGTIILIYFTLSIGKINGDAQQ